MRRLVPTAGVFAALSVAVVTACSPTVPAEPQQAPSSTVAPSASPAPEAPPAPKPVADGPCPYLRTAWVARTNGQRVSRVRLSSGKPPTCFFYTLSGHQQLKTRVYTGDPVVATAIVDAAAPIEQSNPASDPAGWKGGYMSTADGAVYAVSRGGTAVVVTTNQKQSVKAREVAERAVESLEL